MRIALTLMVRDEADIIEPMLEHHLGQGVDHVIVTDNGSVDGTREILEDYARRGAIELRHDPEHRKQQNEVVTAMSRAAAAAGADWVVNADADEFWVAVDPEATLRDVLERVDPELGAFPVPVIDMIGAPARRGTGLQRLRYRDLRSDEELRAFGIHAHSSPDVVFVPNAEVTVAQGNHFVDVESRGLPPEELRLEVLHFPWRSWEQFERKVRAAGLGYEASPHLHPSANHHGMRDYGRLQDGTLLASYLRRHPDADELAAGVADGRFVADDRIAATRTSPIEDVRFDTDEVARQRTLADLVGPVERRLAAAVSRSRAFEDELARVNEGNRALSEELDSALAELAEERVRARGLTEEVAQLRSRRVVRLTDRIAEFQRTVRGGRSGR